MCYPADAPISITVTNLLSYSLLSNIYSCPERVKLEYKPKEEHDCLEERAEVVMSIDRRT